MAARAPEPKTAAVVRLVTEANEAAPPAPLAPAHPQQIVPDLIGREQAFRARQSHYTDDLAELGLERAPLAGRPWPPVISVTPNGYEASLPAPPGTDSTAARGRRLLITQDGAVR